MNTHKSIEEFFAYFKVTEEPQEYQSFPCHITAFQEECIHDILLQTLDDFAQQQVQEAVRQTCKLYDIGATSEDNVEQILTTLKSKGLDDKT